MVNKSKSSFYLHDKTLLIVALRMRRLAGIKQGNFPFTYLGCPVYYGRKLKSYFKELIRKIARRILSWQNQLLTFGGKYTLVCHILQSMSVYLLSAMNPSKSKDTCIPKEEGGLGFRSLHAVNNALFAKLWWNFRISTSLWSNYIGNKYCKKRHPTVSRSVSASHVWKKMVAIREEVEHEIWWQLKACTSSFWFDNWTKQGALRKLKDYLSKEMREHIVNNILPCTSEMNDKAWWMGSSVGNFTVKSAYHLGNGNHATSSTYSSHSSKAMKAICYLCRYQHRRATITIIDSPMVGI
ncbi:hypothetical protein H5410_004882 [Solanum commersonii]|uniref:Reverse transcriptase n=1 Tax=Solanum commersonii TaxID=4109 RepID=A0A9J6A5L6_SOLCO|nr:hypothetical protein H5410_004882 [Solanum commersonii]